MSNSVDASKLVDRVAALVEAARKAGADAADAVAVRGRSSSVSVRLGKVEATESSESDDIALRVFVGKRVASVSATAASDTDCACRASRRHGARLARRSLPGPRRPGPPRQIDQESRPVRRCRNSGRAAEGGRACRRGCRARRSRASPIPAAAAPAPGSAAWCWQPRTASSASMSARASRARQA